MAVLRQLDSVCALLLFLLLSTVSKLTNAHKDIQYMNHSSIENFTIDCDPFVSSSRCKSLTLSQIADNSIRASHVYIDISIPQLQLSGQVEFEHRNSVAMVGRTTTVIRCSERNSGLAFVNVTKVTVVNITLINCGQPYEKDSYYYVIRLLHCKDIEFIHASAMDNRGTAVSILDHQGGTVNFLNCSFINNSIASNNWKMCGGGGVYIGNFDHDPEIPTTVYFRNC